ncbi:hypothetical protein Cst_c18370 [Thermoclostridium stercorarium subsp. stercorarium DSM 8532]|uniref:Uncharacterized protein n=1 Tax=Thermoclostridium stercorarium (strain ATCC 35414 / DSM 8532 / NCIMB 11754) TaxID=1121335 RepID=L7VQ44_THES1|nr:hypothetical protein Cst_c18370 [Thermoclostridium stercorarium subsp. stercorarium DSM 8532]
MYVWNCTISKILSIKKQLPERLPSVSFAEAPAISYICTLFSTMP